MNYTFEGTVKVLGSVQEFDSGFKKREIIVSSLDEKYPQDIKFEFFKDSLEKLEPIKSGDLVKLSFNLRGNEYNGKYFTNLVGFHIAKIKQGTKTETTESLPPVSSQVMSPADAEDDLPF